MKGLASLILAVAAGSILRAEPVDYLRQVKPILSEHCYRCHGASQQKGQLRLDTAASAIKGGEHGAAVTPGSADSLLLQALRGTHPEISRMPYKKTPLTTGQIALIQSWIAGGASAPPNEAPETSRHWSFVAPERPPLPSVKNSGWPRNPIDHFILSRLEKDAIQPSPEADRVTLIRRLSLDLTGLPPNVAEVDAFENDPRPDAYDRLVERLLSSPHYGERWGRHWLDVARYADSNGYSIDAPRSVWKYRDWVIQAFNGDQPFDQFVIEQLAGDLLPKPTIDQLIATGFHRQTQVNQEGGIDPEQFRIESVMDRVNTTGTAFLGLTIACAQCHDHKFDPLTQREYYQLFAFFNSTIEDGHGKSAPEGMLEIPGQDSAAEDLQKDLDEAEGDLDRYLNTQGSAVTKWGAELPTEAREKLKPEVQAALKLAFASLSTKQKRLLYGAYRNDDAEFKERESKLARLERRKPRPVTTLVMRENPVQRESFIFIKGDFTRRGAPVTPGVPAILNPLPLAESVSRGTNALNRLDLARWIVDPTNPLTARVMVNRIWQQYFGRGLVQTENDFGTQGLPPTHPELLDWLATEFMNPSYAASGTSARAWSVKHLHRLIVTSSTYLQSSRARPDLDLADPNNKLLARQNRLRLDAEVVRDAALAASGMLSAKIGGPGVFPPQPAGVMTLGQSRRDWRPSTGPDRYRRGLYTFFWRATPHPALMVFDSPDAFSACTRRVRSNTPLQALTLLNDEAYFEFARGLSRRILAEGPGEDDRRIEFAFRLCVGRRPTEAERQRLTTLLKDEIAALQSAPEEAKELAGAGDSATNSLAHRAAWVTVARVLLNLDEAITRE